MNHNQAQLFTGATDQPESQEQPKKSPQNPNSADFHHADVRSKNPALKQILLDFIDTAQTNNQNLYFNTIKIGSKNYAATEIEELKKAINTAKPQDPITICFNGAAAIEQRNNFLNAFATNNTKTIIFENITNLNKNPHEDADICFHCINNNKNFDISFAQVKNIFDDKEQLNKVLDAIEKTQDKFNTQDDLDNFINSQIKNIKPSAGVRPQISQSQ